MRVEFCQYYNRAIARLAERIVMALITVTTPYKDMAGNKENHRVHGVGATDTENLAKKENKLLSGRIRSASETVKLVLTDYALGHTDAAEEATFELYSPSLETFKNITLDNVSLTYASTLDNGMIDITNIDITDWLAAYNAATVTPGDWVLLSAHYA